MTFAVAERESFSFVASVDAACCTAFCCGVSTSVQTSLAYPESRVLDLQLGEKLVELAQKFSQRPFIAR